MGGWCAMCRNRRLPVFTFFRFTHRDPYDVAESPPSMAWNSYLNLNCKLSALSCVYTLCLYLFMFT